MLDAGALLEPELSLAVWTDDVAVGLEIPDLHILTLEKAADCADDLCELSVLINPFGDIGRERPEHGENSQNQHDYHQNRSAYEQIDKIQNARGDPDECIQFVVSVSAAHELGGLLYESTQIITR